MLYAFSLLVYLLYHRCITFYSSRWLAKADGTAPTSYLQSVYFMSLIMDTEGAAPEMKALALAVQLQLSLCSNSSNNRSGSGSNTSDKALLHAIYGAEECGICGSLVNFNPTHDNSDETESTEQKTGPENTVRGSSVLYGTCEGCSIRSERCCFSLRLLTTPPAKCAISTPVRGSSHSSGASSNSVLTNSSMSGQESRVYACPVCTAATSVCLARTVTAPNSVLRGIDPQALLCPYCAVLMQPL